MLTVEMDGGQEPFRIVQTSSFNPAASPVTLAEGLVADEKIPAPL
jgi:hypothetical protein